MEEIPAYRSRQAQKHKPNSFKFYELLSLMDELGDMKRTSKGTKTPQKQSPDF